MLVVLRVGGWVRLACVSLILFDLYVCESFRCILLSKKGLRIQVFEGRHDLIEVT